MTKNREFCDPDIVSKKIKLIRKTLGESDGVCVNNLTALSLMSIESAYLLGVKKKFFLKNISEMWDNLEFKLEQEQEE